jgi:hypothetical protein
MSYNNTAYLSASTGGTEAFVEQSAVAVRSRDAASEYLANGPPSAAS